MNNDALFIMLIIAWNMYSPKCAAVGFPTIKETLTLQIKIRIWA